ncbi:MAG TPA: cell division protein FtsA [Candidatus Saccharimonadales bacterium]|nr:cell division protein FtsA [Candidatus Saccharimonadales bacterium]
MQEASRYAVGLDIGTTTVRCVVGHVDGPGQAPTIIGVAAEAGKGLRKGNVVTLNDVAQAADKALETAERLSGHRIEAATVSINGTHIVGLKSTGVIAVGAVDHEINLSDLARVEEAATVVQLPANREILDVTPINYKLDNQSGIKDPLGMTGVRLEVDAYMITALGPHLKNLEKAITLSDTQPRQIVVAGLAAAKTALNDQQKENGVALVDIGGTTTNVVVYEEGDLLHLGVVPYGSVNITNDLAIGLKTDLAVAERVKLEHSVASADFRKDSKKTVTVKLDGHTHEFDTETIDEIVEARLEEIFEEVNKELKKAGRQAKLPGGVVLSGGGAKLTGVADYAKAVLKLNARVAEAPELSGVADKVTTPDFATALGLMMIDLDAAPAVARTNGSETNAGRLLSGSMKAAGNLFKKLRS